MSYRPEGWVNLYGGKYESILEPNAAYEAGADAMIEALRANGTPVDNIDNHDKILAIVTDQVMMNLGESTKGHIVFLPEKGG